MLLKQAPFVVVTGGLILFMAALVAGCTPSASGQPGISAPTAAPAQAVSNKDLASPAPTDTTGPTHTPTSRPTATRLPPGPTILPTPSPAPVSTATVEEEVDQHATSTSTLLPPQPPVTDTVTVTSTSLSPPTVQPEADLVTLINQERATQGLTTLEAEPRLMAAAQVHSHDMADHNFFDHAGSDGSEPGDRITRQNYDWRFFAENLACNYPTAETVMQGWLDSPGHRANMLAPEAEQIGIGLVYAPGTDCVYYWTAIFAAGN